jgi:hypothetical protein
LEKVLARPITCGIRIPGSKIIEGFIPDLKSPPLKKEIERQEVGFVG